MDNTGLYIVDSSITTRQMGSNPTTHWTKHKLQVNGKEVTESIKETDTLGTRVVGDKLIHNGDVIATSSDINQIIPTGISLGDTALTSQYCVDITLENYNKLLKGINVAGYSDFSENLVYNIVDNLGGEPVELSTVDPLAKIVYHGGELPENVENEFNSFTCLNAPVLGIHYFNPWCNVGDKVILQYYVDTQDAKFLHQNEIGETYTTIVRDSFDRELAKKTSYGGIIQVELKAFKNAANNANFEGETYFYIQTVDQRGVASATQFFDIRFSNHQFNYYSLSAEDLSTYGIILNDSTPAVAYKNKVQLEKMLWDVRHGDFAQGYDGIKLYNSGNDIYYLDIHRNQGDDVDNPVFHAKRFYVANVNIVDGTRTVTYQEILQGGTVTVNGQTYSINTDPLHWVKEDPLKLYRDDNDKIRVKWRVEDTEYFDSTKHVHSENWDDILVTWKKSYMNNPKPKPLNNPYYYVVDVLEDKNVGHVIRFPNNIALDLNGATLQETYVDDIEGLKFISLRHNNNVIVKNGKIVGPYKSTNLVDLYLNRGASITPAGKFAYASGEGLAATGIFGGKFCKFENIESSNALGYEGSIGYEPSSIGREPKGAKKSYGDAGLVYTEFSRIGYIGYDGNFHNPYNQQGYSGYVLPATSYDYKNGVDRQVTPLTSGDKISINMRYSYDTAPNSADVLEGYTETMDYINEAVPYLYLDPFTKFSFSKQKELFISFYHYNDNGTYTFLRTVKTAAWLLVRIPSNATHITITAFGMTDANGNNRSIVAHSSGKAVSLELYGIKPTLNRGPNAYENCYFHDTRTVALYPSTGQSHFINNSYSQIAIQNNTWKLTQYLSDFEEGGLTINHVNVINCNISGTGAGDGGCVVMHMNYAYNLNIINSGLIGYKDNGGIQTSYVNNCDIKVLSPYRDSRKTFDYTYFKNCRVHDYLNENGVGAIKTGTLYGITYRAIRTEDEIDNRITFRNCIINRLPSSKPLNRNFYHTNAGGTIY